MTDTPFKLRVLRALTDALKTITPANGYQFDLSDFDPGDGVMTARVYRGRAWYGDDDPIPMVSILEGINPADDVAEAPVDTTTGEANWQILVQGFVNDDPEHPTDPAYGLLADIRRRIAAEKKRRVGDDLDPFGFGRGKNRITKVFIGSGVVRPADDTSAKAWMWLSLTLRIVENAAEPYA
jgi:hypothetical protein